MSDTNKTTRLILNDLFNRRIFAWRENTAGIPLPQGGFRPGGKTGKHDIIAILPPSGCFLGIEIKTGHDRLRPEQLGFKANLEQMGGIYLVVKDFDDYQQQLSKLSKLSTFPL